MKTSPYPREARGARIRLTDTATSRESHIMTSELISLVLTFLVHDHVTRASHQPINSLALPSQLHVGKVALLHLGNVVPS